jgi:hypothetical protein
MLADLQETGFIGIPDYVIDVPLRSEHAMQA